MSESLRVSLHPPQHLEEALGSVFLPVRDGLIPQFSNLVDVRILHEVLCPTGNGRDLHSLFAEFSPQSADRVFEDVARADLHNLSITQVQLFQQPRNELRCLLDVGFP